MNTIIKFFLYFTVGIILLSLLTNIIVYGGLIYLTYFVGKKIVLFIKQKRANQKLIEATKAQSDTIEYKMANLLKLSGNYIDAPSVRHAYRKKTDLTLQDKWYQFLDLRAKLELNNTPTGKAEAVLHLMCDEIIARIQSVDVELTEHVKKEFIEENLTPLIDDINEILSGMKPTDTIDINAYDLLKNCSLEKIS
ncbi:MAG: ABC transporter substrate-binding protein [Lysinibacillus sp.]